MRAILPVVMAGLMFAGGADGAGVVNSREIVLHCAAANGAAVTDVAVWVRSEGGEWERAEVERVGQNSVSYTASNDGKYCFYIVLENDRGRSAEAPAGKSTPHACVTVDTKSPTLQIHGAVRARAGDAGAGLRLAVSLIDENLGEMGLRLFYRSESAKGWIDAGPVTCVNGNVIWRPPEGAESVVDIRLTATDLAGNRSMDEIRNVALLERFETAVVREQAKLNPLEPVSVEPVRLAAFEEVAAVDPVILEKAEAARRLHEQGNEFFRRGQLALAEARLEDSLEFMPDQPNVLTDLGNVFMREKQFNLADEKFARALKGDPEHLGATEGRALAAMMQQRYPEAREHIQRLLQLDPDEADNWLHMGDVEHMLGRRAEARAAWNKALELNTADKFILEEAKKRLKVFDSD